jgi:hypothetical protein
MVFKMPIYHVKSHREKPGHRRRWLSTVLASIGYILSPLSWWNDMVVNVPLAYAFSWPFALLYEHLFLPAFVFAYWLTNLLGFVLLHIAIRGFVTSDREKPLRSSKSLSYYIAVSLFYTAIILLCVWLEWIPSPVQLLQIIKTGT